MILSEGRKGDEFTIILMDTEPKVKKRLQDMGLTHGTIVKVISFYANNAFILKIRGSRIVIGKDIAGHIHVEPMVCNICKKEKHRHGHGSGPGSGHGHEHCNHRKKDI
ncbi:MAG: FeoA family protein [Vallitaleaceae bacterium]|jgi:ferrous iron transport protein A|nr:FeoA family protein [Vallitaleaceae bacterium]